MYFPYFPFCQGLNTAPSASLWGPMGLLEPVVAKGQAV